jgi:hypothetical protein
MLEKLAVKIKCAVDLRKIEIAKILNFRQMIWMVVNIVRLLKQEKQSQGN